MFYVRHWSFAASCRGNFELAAGLLLSRLRMFAARSDNQLARSIRGQLAALYLRMGQYEKALEQLDIAQIGVRRRWISSAASPMRATSPTTICCPEIRRRPTRCSIRHWMRHGVRGMSARFIWEAHCLSFCAPFGAGMPAASLLFGGAGAATLPQGAQPYVAGALRPACPATR